MIVKKTTYTILVVNACDQIIHYNDNLNPFPNMKNTQLHGPNGMWKSPTKPWFLEGCLISGGRDYSDHDSE